MRVGFYPLVCVGMVVVPAILAIYYIAKNEFRTALLFGGLTCLGVNVSLTAWAASDTISTVAANIEEGLEQPYLMLGAWIANAPQYVFAIPAYIGGGLLVIWAIYPLPQFLSSRRESRREAAAEQDAGINILG